MEVRYTLSVDDYVAFSVYALRRSGVGRGWYLFGWSLGPVICAASVLGLILIDNLLIQLLAFSLACGGAVATVACPFIYWPLVERNVRAYARKSGTRGITGPITLTLSEEALVEITETTRSEVKWENMKEIVEVGDCTYIYVTGVSAAILSRLGFDSDEEYYDARDFALRKLADRVRS